MVNAKPIIARALAKNQKLTALVPATRIFCGVAEFKGTPEYPFITYEEVANVPSQHFDDLETFSEVVFKVHIWHRESTSAIADIICNSLVNAGFKRRYASDLDDFDNMGNIVRHKVMSFTITLKNNN